MIRALKRDGFLWHHGDGDHEDHLGYEPHEANLEPVLRSLTGHDGKVFLDVGAHVGHWTVRLAPQASKVIAVEANPDTARVLRINVSINELPNVVVYQCAAWDEDTTLTLFNPRAGEGVERCGGTRTLPGEGGTVPARRLDVLLEDEPAIDVVKLDVEGADLHALEGMRGLIGRHGPVLFIERHDMYGYYEFPDMEKKLASLGYVYGHSGTFAGAQYIVARPGNSL